MRSQIVSTILLLFRSDITLTSALCNVNTFTPLRKCRLFVRYAIFPFDAFIRENIDKLHLCFVRSSRIPPDFCRQLTRIHSLSVIVEFPAIFVMPFQKKKKNALKLRIFVLHLLHIYCIIILMYFFTVCEYYHNYANYSTISI